MRSHGKIAKPRCGRGGSMDTPLQIQYVEPGFLLTESSKARYQPCRQRGMVSVVRLFEVDALIQEAVWATEQAVSAMECGVSWKDLMNDVNYQRAQAFLARPMVAAWRERQKKEQT